MAEPANLNTPPAPDLMSRGTLAASFHQEAHREMATGTSQPARTGSESIHVSAETGEVLSQQYEYKLWNPILSFEYIQT